MTDAIAIDVWEVVTDFLATNPSPQEIVDYHFPPEIDVRLQDLLDRNGEDELTDDERNEMFDIVNVASMMSLLKAKTKLKLRNSSS
jgi:hypothetical protein